MASRSDKTCEVCEMKFENGIGYSVHRKSCKSCPVCAKFIYKKVYLLNHIRKCKLNADKIKTVECLDKEETDDVIFEGPIPVIEGAEEGSIPIYTEPNLASKDSSTGEFLKVGTVYTE